MRYLLDAVFARYAWYRRRCGGHWERWYLDVPFTGRIWLPVHACSLVTGRRPDEGCRGTPECETW